MLPSLNSPKEIRKTLFVIPCSKAKSVKNEMRSWTRVMYDACYSAFLEFAHLRREIVEFYSALPSERAQEVYRGYRYWDPRRWMRAWKINKEIPSSGASKAILRYSGRIYRKLCEKVRIMLADKVIDNVLIISALHGPTLPADYIPYYDLTMGDLWRNGKTLGEMWPAWIAEYGSNRLRNFLEKFDRVVLMLSSNYRPAAIALRKIVPELEIFDFSRSVAGSAGEFLNEKLLMLIK